MAEVADTQGSTSQSSLHSCPEEHFFWVKLWFDLILVRRETRTALGAALESDLFLSFFFFFFFFFSFLSITHSCEMCSCPSPQGGRRSGERGRTQSRVRVVGEGFRVSLEMLKQGQVTGADYRTVPPPPRHPCDRKKLTVTFPNVIPPKTPPLWDNGPSLSQKHSLTHKRKTWPQNSPVMRSSQEYVNEPRAGNDQAKKLNPDIDQ